MSDYATTFTSSSVQEHFPLKRFPDVATVFFSQDSKNIQVLQEFHRRNSLVETQGMRVTHPEGSPYPLPQEDEKKNTFVKHGFALKSNMTGKPQ
jgi:hypothetical protein